MAQMRQGDVLVMTAAPPTEAKPEGRSGKVVLANGEVTGHAHVLTAPDTEVYSTANSVDRWLRLRSAGVITHEEHGQIAVEPGCYRVVRQREWTPERARQVAD